MSLRFSIAFLVSTLPALAQPGQPPPDTGLSLAIGAGALAYPVYQGGSRMRVLSLPSIDGNYADTAFFSFPEIGRVDVPRALGIDARGISAGPLARFRFGRTERDNRRDLSGLGNVPGTVELGGFVGYEIGGGFSLRGNLTSGAGGHEGVVGDIGLGWGNRFGPLFVAVSPSVSVVDETYNRAFYGVNARQAARSGRTAYRPGGGFERVSLNLVANLPLTERFAAMGLLNYGRLVGDAAASPIVTGRGGSRDQLLGGLFLTWQAW